MKMDCKYIFVLLLVVLKFNDVRVFEIIQEWEVIVGSWNNK